MMMTCVKVVFAHFGLTPFPPRSNGVRPESERRGAAPPHGSGARPRWSGCFVYHLGRLS